MTKDMTTDTTKEFWGKGPNPQWKYKQGANSEEWKSHKKITFSPTDEGRSKLSNYKMLCSAITPRPIGFLGTVKPNGVPNLAPFSYFNVISADPPLFTVSFSGSKNHKDTLAAILDSGELTINVISEWMIEAANLTAIPVGPEINEWELSGLTPLPSDMVKPPHVAESGFSVEAKLVDCKEYESRFDPGVRSVTVLVVEGVNFHVREDLIDENMTMIDTAKLRPVGRLGGNSYTTITSGYELPRYNYEEIKHEFDT